MTKAEELERKIIGLMTAIKLGTKTKKESGIGALFIQLKAANQAAYDRLIEDYKIIAKTAN